MTFKEWQQRYYPNEDEETLRKIGHAFIAGQAHLACKLSDNKDFNEAIELLEEAEQRFVQYQMDVDSEAPYDHINFMSHLRGFLKERKLMKFETGS